ncbi:hypothetical protein [Chryseobacterium sp. CT-SW4]|uniref:hypothetical protein n=1 Tax=Chryseobacterium sp. SW-1 TaxID=3157343 RepID=UPI003B0137D0
MIIHFVLPTETWESIAQEIQLENPQYLKEYHNQHCGRGEQILEGLSPGKKLLIPGINQVKEYNSRNDAPFKSPEQNPKITFKPENLAAQYKVNITEHTQTENGRNEKHGLSYIMNLTWLEKISDHHVFSLTKTQFSTGKEGKMEHLAKESALVLNPFLITTNLEGEILRVSLSKEVLENFPETKNKLLDLFPDQYALKYIVELEFIISEPSVLDQRMKEDLLMRTFFAPIRNPFNNGKSQYSVLWTDENIPLNIIQKVKPGENDGEIRLLQHAEPPMDYSGEYTVDLKTGFIKKVHITYYNSLYGVKNNTSISIE